MARHSEDFYWTDEQRTWVNNYVKELNEVLSDYESKKKELLEARREYVFKQLLASKLLGNTDKIYKHPSSIQ